MLFSLACTVSSRECHAICYFQKSLLTRSEEVRLARQREEKEREWRDKQLELARQKKEQQDEVTLIPLIK
jgi:hypothetical protein